MNQLINNYPIISMFFFFHSPNRSLCLTEGKAVCRFVYGLTKDQVQLCYKASDVTAAALEGLDLAISECQIQVSWIFSLNNVSNIFKNCSFNGIGGIVHR